MPHAREQRDEVYEKNRKPGEDATETHVRFVHYTSAEAALSIIKSKRIWMRNTTCMSDYREVQHGFDMLNKFFADKSKMEQFVSALDLAAPGAAKQAIDLFNKWWDTIRFHTYITSISEHHSAEDSHGRLSMWRAFGGNIARVALVFKVPYFTGGAQALNLLFSPVAYLTEPEVHAVFLRVIANIKENREFLRAVDSQIIIGTVYSMLLAGVTCLKHEGFREEKEWRAIYSPKIRSSALMESSTELVGGIPQIIYKVPLDEKASSALAGLDLSRIFDRLIIGPTSYPMVMYEAFVDALTTIEVSDAGRKVFTSMIPIRS